MNCPNRVINSKTKQKVRNNQSKNFHKKIKTHNDNNLGLEISGRTTEVTNRLQRNTLWF